MKQKKRRCAGDEEKKSRGGAERDVAGGERGEGEAGLRGLGDPDGAEEPGKEREQIDGDERAEGGHGDGGAAERGSLPLLPGAMPDGGGGGKLRAVDFGVDAGGVLEEERGGLLRVLAGGAGLEVGAQGGVERAGAQGVEESGLAMAGASGHERAFPELAMRVD